MPQRLVVTLALAAAAACSSPRTAPAKSAASAEALDPKTPVARLNGEAITAGELDEAVKSQLRRMEVEYQERVYETRRAGLDSLIVKRLVEAKAKAKGTTPDELVKKEVLDKVSAPTDDEIRALYERAKAGGKPLPPLDQIKGDISRYIQQQKQQEAMKGYWDQLRAEAKVETLLPPYKPPRVEVAAEGPSKGDVKAPVTIVEFSDYQCPYCSRAETTVNQVLADYKDKVRLVYRDFPLPFHENAAKAAEAAHCAGDQGRYWEMHGKLFANQQSLDQKAIKGYARDLGLDQAKFDKCLDTGAKAKLVEASRKAGEEAGVSGTPAFFVNGMMIQGAQPYESFKALIDAELASK